MTAMVERIMASGLSITLPIESDRSHSTVVRLLPCSVSKVTAHDLRHGR